MNIGIIGAGFTGLAAAYDLSRHGHQVCIFESESQPGGLALGFKRHHWDWVLEAHYHHWFTNDIDALSLANELGCSIIQSRPKTSVLVDEKIYQLDSLWHLIGFSKLPFLARLHMALGLAFLKYNPFWKPLEFFVANRTLPSLLGKQGYNLIWKPLLHGKFGSYMDQISLAWFWARVVKRTPTLNYPQGGYLNFAKLIEQKILKQKGKFFYKTAVTKLEIDRNNSVRLFYKDDSRKLKGENFDAVLVTLPLNIFVRLASSLPISYQHQAQNFKGLGALNLILRLHKRFLADGTYWLNICNLHAPFLALVEHTNFMDSSHYGGEHIIYLGNYLSSDHPYYKKSKYELLDEYDPFLKKINLGYRKELIDIHRFAAPFAQPIIGRRYSQHIPPMQTPLKNVYLANMQQVYPWDRGTTYAIAMGRKVAKLMEKTV